MKIEIEVARDTSSHDFEELLAKLHAFCMREEIRPLIRDIVINPGVNDVMIEYSIKRV